MSILMRVPKKVEGFYFQKTILMSDKAPALSYWSTRQSLCGNFRRNLRFLKKFISHVFDKYNLTKAQKNFFLELLYLSKT